MKGRLSNLNGTDFIPYFIDQVKESSSVSLYLYQCYDPGVGKDASSLQAGVQALERRFGVDVKRAEQSLYSARGEGIHLSTLKHTLAKDENEIKIFLNCTGTPFQEIWSLSHSDIFENTNSIVFSAGGLIDYLSGFEKRAPRWVVKARVLETFRRICANPKKNIHKFLSMFGVIRFLRKPLQK